LNYLADEAVYGGDFEPLYQTLRAHLARCPRCREYYLGQLREFEVLMIAQEENVTPYSAI